MALRLRRGTNAERQLITPAQGELIYTTDTKALYIGDGATAGGIIVQGAGGGGGSLNDLSDVNVGSVTDGQVLTYSTANSQWQPQNGAGISLGAADGHTDISYGADNTAIWGDFLLHDGNQFVSQGFANNTHKISIAGDDSTIMVNHATGDLSGHLVSGDVKGGNLIGGDMLLANNEVFIDNSIRTANGLSLKDDFGGVAYNSATKLFTGDLSGNMQGDIYSQNMTKVFDHVTGQWLGDIQGDLYSGDSTKAFNRSEGKFYGQFDGVLDGDHKGSVFSDNSTLLLDGINNTLYARVETDKIVSGNIVISQYQTNSIYLKTNAANVLSITTEDNTGTIVLARNTQIGGASDTGNNRTLGVYNDDTAQGTTTIRTFHASDAGYGGSYAALRSRGTKAAPTAVQSGDQLGAYSVAAYNGSAYKAAAGIRFLASATPEANRIPTNIELYNSASNGDQTVVLQIAQTDSVASFSGAIQLKVVADDTARSAAVTAPAAGMIIFNSTGTKFQGYTGAAWVDLN